MTADQLKILQDVLDYLEERIMQPYQITAFRELVDQLTKESNET